MLRIMESPLKLLTHTEELTDNASIKSQTKPGSSQTALTLLPVNSKLYSLPLLNNQFQLLLKPIIYPSNYTREVFTQELAEPDLTTVFWLSDMVLIMERNTIESRTHGVLDGV